MLSRRPPASGPDGEAPRLIAEALDGPELDVLVATDQVGKAGDSHRPLVTIGGEITQRALDHAPVLVDECPLDAPYPSVPERIERGAAQATERDQQSERAFHPCPQRELPPEAECPEDRRMDLVTHLRLAHLLADRRPDLGPEM